MRSEEVETLELLSSPGFISAMRQIIETLEKYPPLDESKMRKPYILKKIRC